MKHRYTHKIECAIRALFHGNAACSKLVKYLIEQQRPDFKKQDHLFGKAARDLKKALKWVKAGRTPPAQE